MKRVLQTYLYSTILSVAIVLLAYALFARDVISGKPSWEVKAETREIKLATKQSLHNAMETDKEVAGKTTKDVKMILKN